MATIINGVGRVGIRQASVSPGGGGGGYTTRTQAFATATGIADTTILNALNTFDLGLISNGLDTKMKALYPFVGGTSTTHKFNFMDARDLDVAFRLTFSGGFTHNLNGVTPNGINGKAISYYNPSVNGIYNNISIGYYSRNTAFTKQKTDFCGQVDGGFNGLWNATFSTATYLALNSTYNVSLGFAHGKYFNYQRSGNLSTDYKVYNEGNILIPSYPNTSIPPVSGNIQFFARIDNNYFSDINYALMDIKESLTDAENLTYSNLVQTLQTSLGRQV